jgi:hypothetical protein
MNIRRVAAAGLWLFAALAPVGALACDNVFGIPTESRIRLLWLDPAAPADAPIVVAESRCSIAAGHRYAAATVSADGGAIAAWHEKGLEVHFGGRRRLVAIGGDWSKLPFPYGGPGSFEWAPDGRRLALALPVEGPEGKRVRRVAVLDVRRLGDDQPLRVVGTVEPGASLYALQWAPGADALLQLEALPGPDGSYGAKSSSRVRRVPLDGRPPTTVLEHAAALDFYLARTHHGRLGGTEAVEALFGVGDDLFVLRPGGQRTRLEVPGRGLFSIDWHPTRDLVAMFFRRPVHDARGRTWRGLYLVDLARPDEATQLHDGADVRTVWFSPRGTYLGWSTPTSVSYRPVDSRAQAVTITPPSGEADADQVRGCGWSQDEKRLAWCVGPRLFVRDVTTGADTQVDLRPEHPARAFAGLPQWVGDQLLVTLFEDLGGPAAVPDPRRPPTFGTSGEQPRPPARQR